MSAPASDRQTVYVGFRMDRIAGQSGYACAARPRACLRMRGLRVCQSSVVCVSDCRICACDLLHDVDDVCMRVDCFQSAVACGLRSWTGVADMARGRVIHVPGIQHVMRVGDNTTYARR